MSGRLARLAQQVVGSTAAAGGDEGAVVTPAMREFWDRNGYVVVPGCVPLANLEAVKKDIFEFIGGSRADPDSWYVEVPQEGSPVPAFGKGGMVQMFQVTNHLCRCSQRASPVVPALRWRDTRRARLAQPAQRSDPAAAAAPIGQARTGSQ